MSVEFRWRPSERLAACSRVRQGEGPVAAMLSAHVIEGVRCGRWLALVRPRSTRTTVRRRT